MTRFFCILVAGLALAAAAALPARAEGELDDTAWKVVELGISCRRTP